MTRHVILGNGNMLVCLDKNARIRDFYYPYVGQENHVSGNTHRTGVWVGGKFSWVSKDDWDLKINYRKDSLVSQIKAINKTLKVELDISEVVPPDKNIFLRHVKVKNNSNSEREIRVFFSQHFHISEANIGDTVDYDPALESIIDYKGKRYFLIGGKANGKSFTDYSTGVAGAEGKEGTYVDAEDGTLCKNPIEHGSVDSTIGFSQKIKPNSSDHLDYWITVGEKHREVRELREYILKHSPDKIIMETEKHWSKWVNKKKIKFEHLGNKIQDLFKRSLLIVRAQTDNHGAIIAANDTHTFHNKKDTYSYMWPRDGALIARSLDKVGHYEITNRFFNFCSNIISEDGYLFHKYRPDGSLGSSWHSWLKGDKLQLPIQEDETALVLDALWKHYDRYQNRKEIKNLYNKFIKKAGDFLCSFRDKKTHLPKESYDLWEEKLGVYTFTCSTVYAGLLGAMNLAKSFGKTKDVKKYEKAAIEVKESILKYLYDDEDRVFIKGISYQDEQVKKDKTIDVSTFYGLFEYKILDIEDIRLTNTFNKAYGRLWSKTAYGGLIRYENDKYYRLGDNYPENPWFISTMWLAEYYIAKAKNLKELNEAEKILRWATERALPSGVLSEQINPMTGEHLSVAPLTWSHAGFIIAVIKYLEKYRKLVKKKKKS